MKKLLLLLPLLFSITIQCKCSNAELKVGDLAPQFALLDQNGNTVNLSDFKGKKVALYFYPKDNTPGCSEQACSLRDDFEILEDAGIMVLGLSKGSVRSKQKFIQKKKLNFPLLIATNNVLKAYGVNTGLLRLYLPKRWTFLIDEYGIIVGIIKNVDTKHHAEQILDAFNAVK